MKALSVFLYSFGIMLIIVCVCSELTLLGSAVNGRTSHVIVFLVSILNGLSIAGSLGLCHIGWQLWKEGDRRENPYSSQYRLERTPDWLNNKGANNNEK